MSRLFLLMVILGISVPASAQFEMGLKAGVSSMDLADNSLFISSGSDNNTTLSISEANYGYHFGLYSRVKLFNIYIEPALLFNSSRVDYNIREEIFDTGVVETTKSEKFEKLDIPVLVGMKFGFVRIQAGPVAHIHLNSVSELTDFDGYSEKFDNATYGYQLGAGLDIAKVRLDINYEGNFNNYGEHIVIDGEHYNFDENPSRIVASLGYRF